MPDQEREAGQSADELIARRAAEGAAPAGVESAGELDPASRSLSEALRLSFTILRFVIVVLLAVFLLSGSFKVREGEVAVRLRLGAVQGYGDRPVFPPGGPYFAWPEPVDVVVRVPTGDQQLRLDRSFWFNLVPGAELLPLDQIAVPSGGLVPGEDGSLVTADRNVLHGQFVVSWRILEEAAPDFVRNVSASGDPKQMIAAAERILRGAAEQAVVETAAQATADEFLLGQVAWDLTARRALQGILDRLQAGVLVTKISLVQKTPPLAVRAAFRTVNEAEGERAKVVLDAEAARARTLGEAAGEAHPVALAAIAAYESAVRRGSPQAARIERALAEFFRGASADVCFAPLAGPDAAPGASPEDRARFAALLKPVRLSGAAWQSIEQARTEAQRMPQALRAEAESFLSRLQEYRRNPRVVRDRLWQETLNELFAGDVERFYLPPGSKEVRLDLNRDPNVQKRKEQESYEKRVKEEKEKARK